jgi:hypothetical protein
MTNRKSGLLAIEPTSKPLFRSLTFYFHFALLLIAARLSSIKSSPFSKTVCNKEFLTAMVSGASILTVSYFPFFKTKSNRPRLLFLPESMIGSF